MIIKLNGVPIEELSKEGVDVSFKIVDAWELIHVPVNMDVGITNVDLNPTNVPIHLFHVVKPHVITLFEHIF